MIKFSFIADTIDGKIQDFPETFFLDCALMKPMGIQIVRDYNANECIQAMKVFIVYYEGQLFGTRRYKSTDEFVQARGAVCFPEKCYLLVNGCELTFNGCGLIT